MYLSVPPKLRISEKARFKEYLMRYGKTELGIEKRY